MKLGHLRQIILYVEDMNKQVEFYNKKLGLEIAFPHVEDYSTEDWVAFNTGECTLALHSGGKGRIGEDAPKFTFEVENVDNTRKSLDDLGIESSTPVQAYPGSYVCSIKDPEGNHLFFQSHPK